MEFVILFNFGYVLGELNCFEFYYLKKIERISFVFKGFVRIEEMLLIIYVM